MNPAKEGQMFNALFAAMGMLLLSVALWIGNSVAHLPAIEQRLDDYIARADERINNLSERMSYIERHASQP